MKQAVNIFWFRRDLRLEDNAGLFRALRGGHPVLPVFIFDNTILEKLERDDARVSFIYNSLLALQDQLQEHGGQLLVRQGSPGEVWRQLIAEFNIREVYTNEDYEPYAIRRDLEVGDLLRENSIAFHALKDQAVFVKNDIVKADGSPYTVYTPYMKRWLLRYNEGPVKPFLSENYLSNLAHLHPFPFPGLGDIGFRSSEIHVPPFNIEEAVISGYPLTRDIPGRDGTSRIGPYLRFGRVGIRQLVERVRHLETTYLKELVWREFFMQVLWHFPQVVDHSFREKYDRIEWINDEKLFLRWCQGKTGYPMVDAGMRELKATGFMHNRVRMITASFLCKHLLTDWRWGEAWFAKHLLDYELASNNGNWQWAAGTGCDAAPYFRVFNPAAQQQKFDPGMNYIRKWVPEYGSDAYPAPVVDHKIARERAILTYKKALSP